MSPLFRPLPCLFVLAALASPSGDAGAAAHKASQPEKKQERKAEPSGTAGSEKEENHSRRVAAKHHKKKKNDDTADAKPELTGDLAVLKDAFDLARHGKTND